MSGYSNTTGIINHFIGYQSGYSNTTGSGNQFDGFWAGYSNTTGDDNLFVGDNSGYSNISGNQNTFLGRAAGKYNANASYNVYTGSQAGFFSNSSYNVYNGYQAGYKATTGGYNTCVGYMAGHENVSGGGNVMIGYAAGYYELGSQKLYIANSSTNSPLIYGDFAASFAKINGNLAVTGTITQSSDQRLKKNITPIKNSLSRIQQVSGVTYDWTNNPTDSSEQIGFVAQELEKVFPQLVKTDEKGMKSVAYANMTAVLLQAIKEQQQQIDELKKAISDLKK
jgi:hypothetical protein